MKYRLVLAALLASAALAAPAAADLSIGGSTKGNAVIRAPLPSANVGIESRSSVDAGLPAGLSIGQDADIDLSSEASIEEDAEVRAATSSGAGADEEQKPKKRAVTRHGRKPPAGTSRDVHADVRADARANAAANARTDAHADLEAGLDTDLDAGIKAETSMKLRLNE